MAVRDNVVGSNQGAFVLLSGYTWRTPIGNASQATGSNNIVTAPAIVIGGSYVKNSATKMTFTFDKPVRKYRGNLSGCLLTGLTVTINGIQINNNHVKKSVENWSGVSHNPSALAYVELTFPKTNKVVIELSAETNNIEVCGVFE